MIKCDALVNGRRCKKSATWTIPTHRKYDPVIGGEKQRTKDVHLCNCHASKRWRLMQADKRLPLIYGGFLGSWNKYKFGSTVTVEENIDWETVEVLHCPKYWAEESYC